MEVPRLGVELELQLLAYAIATAMWDPSRICDPHHSSRQCRILNPLSGARCQIQILIDTSWIDNMLSHIGNSLIFFFLSFWLHLWHAEVLRLGVEFEL